MGCTVQEVRQVRRSSATDHAVADCSNLVFCVLLATSANPQEGGVTCSRLGALQTKRAAQFNIQ